MDTHVREFHCILDFVFIVVNSRFSNLSNNYRIHRNNRSLMLSRTHPRYYFYINHYNNRIEAS